MVIVIVIVVREMTYYDQRSRLRVRLVYFGVSFGAVFEVLIDLSIATLSSPPLSFDFMSLLLSYFCRPLEPLRFLRLPFVDNR